MLRHFLTTLEVSFMLPESSIMLLENIYSTYATHDDYHLRSSYFYSTGHWAEFSAIDVGVLVYILLLCSQQKQPNLELMTQPKQLIGLSPVSFSLSRHKHRGCIRVNVT